VPLPSSITPSPTHPLTSSSAHGWRAALLLTLAIVAARLIYLIWFCPFELAADEAQYWDWSRRLEFSYYSKGPGIALLIAGATRLLGAAEWAIRAPAGIAIGIAALAVARLALPADGPRGRGALLACAMVWVIPAYHAAASFMTIDAPFLACWALAALAGFVAIAHVREGRSGTLAWLGLGAALGVGFLFKYTILLLVPGLVIAMFLERRSLRWSARSGGAAIIGALTAAALTLPVILWNNAHGWPTARHLLRHIGVRADEPETALAEPRPWSYDPMWTLELLGTQIAAVGPALGVMVLSIVSLRRSRGEESDAWRLTRYCIACAAPVLIFYFGATLARDAEANWPIAAYLTLCVPAGLALAGLAGRARSRVMNGLWRASIAYGMIAALGIWFIPLLDRVPRLGEAVAYHRIQGHREFSRQVQRVIDDASAATGRDAVVITSRYGTAALLAYYLPGRPVVRCGSSALGSESTAYDFFVDARLDDPALVGAPVVLVGAAGDRWQNALRVTGATEVLAAGAGKRPPVYLGLDFRGVRGGAPSPTP